MRKNTSIGLCFITQIIKRLTDQMVLAIVQMEITKIQLNGDNFVSVKGI